MDGGNRLGLGRSGACSFGDCAGGVFTFATGHGGYGEFWA